MIARERGDHLVDCCSLLSSFSASASAREIIEAHLLESSDAANHFYKLLRQTWMMRKEEREREREDLFTKDENGNSLSSKSIYTHETSRCILRDDDQKTRDPVLASAQDRCRSR